MGKKQGNLILNSIIKEKKGNENEHFIIEGEEKRRVFLHDDHGHMKTRRDFLSSGILSFAGWMMTPSILQMLARNEAFAQAAGGCDDSVVSASGRLPAFVTVNLAGGASLSGNYIPLNAAGQMLPSYSLLGNGAVPTTQAAFGNVLFSSTSGFIAGLNTGASQATRDKTSFIGVCVPTADDTNTNKIDPSGMVTAAGLKGELLPRLGSFATATGVNQRPAVITPPTPLRVASLNDLTNALTPQGTFATRFTTAAQRNGLLKLVSNLSGSQAAAIASPNSASGQTLAKLVKCATEKNVSLAANTNPGINPATDTSIPNYTTLWGTATAGNQFGQSQNTRVAMGAMVYNALKGTAGTVGINLGGYDYHGNARATTNQSDNNAGQVVGRILETAAMMNQKVFVHVTTDGSVGAPSGSAAGANYTSDRGTGGMSYILVFDPAAKPATKSTQIGYFNNGQGAVDATISGTAEKAGVAVFANYLAFAKQLPLLDKVIPGRLSAAEIEQAVRLA